MGIAKEIPMHKSACARESHSIQMKAILYFASLPKVSSSLTGPLSTVHATVFPRDF